jgi:glucose-6-phosphate 1-dehydrogenase
MVELEAEQQCGSDELLPYEELLEDAMRGRQTWFARKDYVECAWRILDPLLANKPPVHSYEPGSWGPAEADRLIKDFSGWANPV